VLTNRSTYPIQYQAVVLDGVTEPPEDIERAVRDALAPLSELDEKQPKISWQSLGETGATVVVEFWQPVGSAVTPRVLTKLKERFPQATTSVRKD
ncbi:MAG TPA: hypothetical protein VGR08_06700, partial [Thermomicrobiales bacterium]|nr:hypothetical protein [Thermomicrobiales bacterium]